MLSGGRRYGIVLVDHWHMKNLNIRRQIAREAARLLLRQEEADVAKARARAAMRLVRETGSDRDLPSFAEIETQVQYLSRIAEPQLRHARVREAQVAALNLMRSLSEFSPRLVGDPAFGYIYRGREIRLEVTANSPDEIHKALKKSKIDFVDRKSCSESGLPDEGAVTLSLQGRFPILLKVLFPADIRGEEARSAPARGIGPDALEGLLRKEQSPTEQASAPKAAASPILHFRKLLAALEHVQQDNRTHPEGDALYHSLQVFELARQAYPYDEEFLLAALLHDVGKAIDPRDHVNATVRAIENCTSPRTRWFIENLPLARQWLDGTAGRRLRARLESHPDFEQLVELARMDRQGRGLGVPVRDLDSVLGELERLAREND